MHFAHWNPTKDFDFLPSFGNQTGLATHLRISLFLNYRRGCVHVAHVMSYDAARRRSGLVFPTYERQSSQSSTTTVMPGSPLVGPGRMAHWLLLSGICTLALLQHYPPLYTQQEVPARISKELDRCRSLTAVPGPPSDFHSRSASDRFEPGTKPTVIAPAPISSMGLMY